LKLHLVGGFLGSGKTTAIITAAKSLMARGLRVGVITNDQGKYLVDTAFVRLASLPAVEVTGGCFCCNYDDLNSRLLELIENSQPQVIFAESVGSCADIVATVIKPLLSLGGEALAPSSFSVFTDARLLLRRLNGAEMPFNEDVVYIFDQQIEEAGLLIINKADLLPFESIRAIETQIEKRYAGLPYLFQTSLTEEGVWDWVNKIQSVKAALPQRSLAIDYERYAAGEAVLAWLDQEIMLKVPTGKCRHVIQTALRDLMARLKSERAGVGHIKMLISAGGEEVKISFPSIEEPGWEEKIPDIGGEDVHLLLNARVEIDLDVLRKMLDEVFDQPGVKITFGIGEGFYPKEPRPTHRM
jgi:Ni2+-binding GTPase involved in maturation of urease and hydrogenase